MEHLQRSADLDDRFDPHARSERDLYHAECAPRVGAVGPEHGLEELRGTRPHALRRADAPARLSVKISP